MYELRTLNKLQLHYQCHPGFIPYNSLKNFKRLSCQQKKSGRFNFLVPLFKAKRYLCLVPNVDLLNFNVVFNVKCFLVFMSEWLLN